MVGEVGEVVGEDEENEVDDEDGLVAYKATKITKSTAVTMSDSDNAAMMIFGRNDVDRRRLTFNSGISVPFSVSSNMEGISV